MRVSATYLPPNWPKWPRLSGTFCIGNEAPDFVVIFHAGGRLDAAGAIDSIRVERGHLGNILGIQAAGDKGARQIESAQLIERDSTSGAAEQLRVKGVEQDEIGAARGDGGGIAGLQPARHDRRERPACERGVVLVAGELQQVERRGARSLVDIVAGSVDEHANDRGARADGGANLEGAIDVDTARSFRIEVQADHIGAGGDRGARVLDASDAADFHSNSHSARINSPSFTPGVPPRSKLSPIRNACAPAASSRRMSAGESIPLSVTISASPL